MKLIIDIPEKMYHMMNAGIYDYGDMNIIIRNSIPIPDNATNEIETIIRRYTDEQTN